jgi:hypothetical protein
VTNADFRSDNLGDKFSHMGGLFNLGIRRGRFWRALIGVVVAYAVAAQSLLIPLGGFALPAEAHENAPTFELCLHDTQEAPALPARNPGQSGCTHCIFCFAGSHHALVGSPPVLAHRVDVEFIDAPRVATKRHLPDLPPYSIASPRGPPLGP